MAATPIPAADPRDADHLRLLAMFHALFGGLALCGLGFLYLHYRFMSTVFSPGVMQHQKGAPPQAFLDLFAWIYAVLAFACIAGAVLNLLAAHGLRRRRWRMFCMAVAGLDCMQLPMGTALGIFTLIVLSRDSVRRLFERP